MASALVSLRYDVENDIVVEAPLGSVHINNN
jgi:hypothetical protein